MTCEDCIHKDLCFDNGTLFIRYVKGEDKENAETKCPFKAFKNKADFVEIELLKDWLWEIALNNVGGDFSIACQDIISRLDGLRNFAKERK